MEDPMAATLQNLIDTATARKTADLAKIKAGADATGDLATAQSLIDHLTEVKTLCDDSSKSASDRLTAAKAAGVALSGNPDYTKATADVGALLKKVSPDNKLDDAQMKTEIGKDKLPLDTWPNLVAAAAAAKGTQAASQLASDEAQIGLTAARQKLDLRTAALLGKVGVAEGSLQSAQSRFGTAQRLVVAGDAAGAWFALYRAAAGLDAASKVDITADLVSVKAACDDYTAAADAAIKADAKLASDAQLATDAASAVSAAEPLAQAALTLRATQPTP
jgi:hypothetical protein